MKREFKFNSLLAVAIVIAILVLVVSNVAAQNAPGSLDTTFGTGGKVVSPIGTSSDVAQGIAVQADGKIVVVGTAFTPTRVFPVVRYNANGTLDASFGNNGVVALEIGSAASGDSYAVAIQPDGKIVAGGRASLNVGEPTVFVLVRLNTNGSLDTTFDGDGKVTTPFEAGNAQIRALEIQPDGKIVAGGDSFPGSSIEMSKFAVARYNADGSLDATFDGDGKQLVDLGLGRDTIFGIAVQADGKVVATGNRSPTVGILNEDFAVVRFNQNGSLDTTFDTDGIVTFEFVAGAFERPGGIFVQPDGKIVAGGFSFGGAANRFALVRLNTDGSFDTTFDDDGKVLTVVGAAGAAYAVKLQSNGKIVAGGGASNGTSSDFAVARYNADGSPDATFGTNGQTITPIGAGIDQAYAMAIQPNGKIVLAGEIRDSNGASDFALVRYNGDALVARDAVVDFNGDGKTDFSVLRSAGFFSPITWFNVNNGTGEQSQLNLGIRAVDQPVPADYDGDGKDDIAMFRFRNSLGAADAGNWYILQSSTNTFRVEKFGAAFDDPTVVDDYDGDGKDDLAVFRAPTDGPGQAFWYYRGSANNPNGNITYVPWGVRYNTGLNDVDEPYSGDFDGDGKADFRVQRPVNTEADQPNGPAVFYTLTAAGQVSYDSFSLRDDRIVPGDYDGDGKTDLCVARGFNISPGETSWYIRYASGIPDAQIVFGAGGTDAFAQGDYDGDGKTDLAVYRASEGVFYWLASGSNNAFNAFSWGQTGDLPAAGYNNR